MSLFGKSPKDAPPEPRPEAGLGVRPPSAPRGSEDVQERPWRPERPQGFHGLFGDREIRSSGGHHHDATAERHRRRFRHPEGAATLVVHGPRQSRLYGREDLGRAPGSEHRAAALRHVGGDARHVIGRLAGAEDDFRHADAQGAVVVDVRGSHLDGEVVPLPFVTRG